MLTHAVICDTASAYITELCVLVLSQLDWLYLHSVAHGNTQVPDALRKAHPAFKMSTGRSLLVMISYFVVCTVVFGFMQCTFVHHLLKKHCIDLVDSH